MTKQKTAATKTSSNVKKHPAQLAEAELNHLEVILGLANRQFAVTAQPGLDLAYW